MVSARLAQNNLCIEPKLSMVRVKPILMPASVTFNGRALTSYGGKPDAVAGPSDASAHGVKVSRLNLTVQSRAPPRNKECDHEMKNP
jgi:hypothetical protein